jgi:pre-mRNA-processing factor SLU7
VGWVRCSVSWGTDVAENVQLDQAKLAEALAKEERRQAAEVEVDDRKRGYNVRHENVEVTEEEMEAYRLKKQRTDDPLQVPGGGSGTSGYDLV